jgi:elongation factor G
VAIVGPNGVGKTTLLESLLFVSGRIPRKGRIEDGSTVGDASAEARARGMSTELSCATTTFEDVELTLLDCPGSVEFSQETRGALIGVDAAIVVIEPLVERAVSIAPVLKFLDRHAIPHLVFINKMDRSETRYRDLLQALRGPSDRPVVPYQYAIGRGESLVGYVDLVTEQAYAFQSGAPADVIPLPDDHREREQAARTEMLESLADFDDDLMTMLLEDQEPPAEAILKDLRQSLQADQIVPVFMGVATDDKGVRRLLHAVCDLVPDASAAAARHGLEPDGPAVVQILKTYHTPHAGKLSLARVWRGAAKDGMTLGGDRVGGVFRMLGGQHDNAGSAEAGQVVGLGRLETARTGDVLAEGNGAVPDLPAIEPLASVYAMALRAANRNDEVKMSAAMAKLTDEDPSLIFEPNPETHQILLRGQGEMHLRVALERLSEKYHVAVEAAPPETPYQETIRKPGHAHGRHKRQTGGHGQFGDVKIDIRPLGRGEGFAFENKIVGGSVPKQYIPAVEAGAREFMAKGPLGFPVVDVGVTLLDGQFHAVDSSEMAFKTAVALALREGLPQCHPVLLEPILAVQVSVPSDYTSKVLQLVSGKRGQILGFEAKDGWDGWDTVSAHIPQAEMHDLIVSLRSLSQGVGFFEWSFDHMQEVPDRLTEQVAAHKRAAEAAH